jgi:hypothetical protein
MLVRIATQVSGQKPAPIEEVRTDYAKGFEGGAVQIGLWRDCAGECGTDSLVVFFTS